MKSPAAAFTFSNTNLITINDSTGPPTKATYYPSSLTVSGLTGQVITHVSVTLHGLSHTFPSDVDVLLVGPLGQKALIISEVGGDQPYSVTNLTLTLDDDATNSLPISTSLTSGIFKPTERHSTLYFDFPPPAPPGRSNLVSSLSAFNNTDPTGTWNLFVVDDTANDSGSISGGWDLKIAIVVPLKITRSQTDVVIDWPASAQNAFLQSSHTPADPAAWSNVLTAPINLSDRFSVTTPIQNENMFYRLISH